MLGRLSAIRTVTGLAFVAAVFACAKTLSETTDVSPADAGDVDVVAEPVDAAVDVEDATPHCPVAGGRPDAARASDVFPPLNGDSVGCESCFALSPNGVYCCREPDGGRLCQSVRSEGPCPDFDAAPGAGCLAPSDCGGQVQCCDERARTGETACRKNCEPNDPVLCSRDSDCRPHEACYQVSGEFWTCQPCR